MRIFPKINRIFENAYFFSQCGLFCIYVFYTYFDKIICIYVYFLSSAPYYMYFFILKTGHHAFVTTYLFCSWPYDPVWPLMTFFDLSPSRIVRIIIAKNIGMLHINWKLKTAVLQWKFVQTSERSNDWLTNWYATSLYSYLI